MPEPMTKRPPKPVEAPVPRSVTESTTDSAASHDKIRDHERPLIPAVADDPIAGVHQNIRGTLDKIQGMGAMR